MAENIVELNDANFEAEVLKSTVPVIVDFWAEWCAPCRMVAPVIEELAQELDGMVKVAKLNVDNNSEIAAKYEIMSIPTVMLFRGGEVASQAIGAMSKDSLVKELGLDDA